MVWYLPFRSFDALKTGMFSLEAWLLEKIFVLLDIKFPRGNYQPLVPRRKHAIVEIVFRRGWKLPCHVIKLNQ